MEWRGSVGRGMEGVGAKQRIRIKRDMRRRQERTSKVQLSFVFFKKRKRSCDAES